MTSRSHMSLIKSEIGPEQVELFALELESYFPLSIIFTAFSPCPEYNYYLKSE